ncbi:MAG: hypothetical protein QOD44_3857 [Solirubrobacteraceae bacterium]|nr:hypothetical protein [Solirubrobacteraceae bacterium]
MQARAPALIVLLAVGLRLVYGPGHLGYDAVWALEWGREAVGGALPGFESPAAPTPHPLANAVSLVLAPFGGAGMAAVMALSWLSFSALGVLAFLLGRRLYSAWVGAAFAVVVLTRHLLVGETQQALVDVPFLALVVGALLVEAGRPRERTLVPVLLCAGGLLRPEGWLLGLAWLAYAGRGQPRAQLVRWAALVAAAPVLWALSDLVVTGDPLYSLHGTQDLAAQLERPREVGTAFSALPSYLRDALGDPIMWLGLGGAAAGLLGLYERTLLPAALAAAGLVGFLVLGLADLPLLVRYLLVPAVMLCLFSGLLAFGWTVVPRGDRGWRAWVAAGVVCLAVAAAYAPRQARTLRDARAAAVATAAVQDDLRRIADTRAFRSAAARCPTLWVPDARPRPLLAFWLERSPASIRVAGRPAGGLAVVYATPEAARRFALTAPLPPAGSDALPAGGRLVARNASWLVAADC